MGCIVEAKESTLRVVLPMARLELIEAGEPSEPEPAEAVLLA